MWFVERARTQAKFQRRSQGELARIFTSTSAQSRIRCFDKHRGRLVKATRRTVKYARDTRPPRARSQRDARFATKRS